MRNLKKQVSDPIPSDLLIEIFSRLPTKSIARFRCVSKFWSSIIRSPDFTKLFMKTPLTCQRFLISFEEDGKLFFSSPQTQEQDKYSSDLVVVHVAYFPTDVPFQICRPINGWLCRQYLNVTVVYNLITGDTVTLPKVRTENRKSRSYLGYDPVGKKFKVLSMNWFLCGIQNKSEGKVFTLGKNIWRKVEYCRPHYPLNDGICINGVLYYPAEEKHCSGASMIVIFNVRFEKFGYINVGQTMVITRDSPLVNYKGRLALLDDAWKYMRRHRFYGRPMDILLWILQNAEEHKWSKHFYKLPYSIGRGYDEPAVHFVGMAGTCDIIFSPYYLYDPFYVFYYNIEKDTIQKVQIRGLEAFKVPKVNMIV